MKKFIIVCSLLLMPYNKAKADLWGADLPLLAEIVFNTLHTMMELEQQSQYWFDQMEGVRDKIDRIRTISEMVQPSSWDQWRDPHEAMRRLKNIYYTMPKEYRSEKAEVIESELSKAMNLISRVRPEAQTTFASGKELERRGADASPAVAQKLTASGVGTLISMEAQTQVIQSHITSLLAQMLADANEKESRAVASKGSNFSWFSKILGQFDNSFSSRVMAFKAAL